MTEVGGIDLTKYITKYTNNDAYYFYHGSDSMPYCSTSTYYHVILEQVFPASEE